MIPARRWAILALAVLLCLVHGHAWGGQQIPLDAVILMDDSGSMRKTDPLNLRLSALALLIRLLRDDDAVGIVKFDDGAQVVVPLYPIGAEKDRRALYKADTAFSARGAYTNIYTGLKTALQEMQQRARDNTEKAVVLISDGLMDVNPASGLSNEDVLRALHSALLPEYKEARVKIITLALSPAADRSLLLAIAAVTDGRYFYTPKAEDLSQAIFGIFDELKAPEMVPLKGQRAILDASVKEATFFIATDVSKGGVALVRPDGARLERSRQDPTAKWFVGKDYVLCTIQRPMVGEWRVETSGQRPTKVVVITDLRLEIALEGRSYVIGQEVRIAARLVGVGHPEASSLRLAELTLTANVIDPSTAASTTIPLSNHGGKGTELALGQWYAATYPRLSVPGEYRGSVIAVGPTFRREKSFAFRALAPQGAGAASGPVVRTTPEPATPGQTDAPTTPAPDPTPPMRSSSPPPPPQAGSESGGQEAWSDVLPQFAMAHGFLVAIGVAALLGRRLFKRRRWARGKHPMDDRK